MMRPETGQEYPLRLGSSILGRQHDSQFCSLRFPFMPQSASRKDPARLDVAQDGGMELFMANKDPGRPELLFKGQVDPTKDDLECVAIFDGHHWRLELLSATVHNAKYAKQTGIGKANGTMQPGVKPHSAAQRIRSQSPSPAPQRLSEESDMHLQRPTSRSSSEQQQSGRQPHRGTAGEAGAELQGAVQGGSERGGEQQQRPRRGQSQAQMGVLQEAAGAGSQHRQEHAILPPKQGAAMPPKAARPEAQPAHVHQHQQQERAAEQARRGEQVVRAQLQTKRPAAAAQPVPEAENEMEDLFFSQPADMPGSPVDSNSTSSSDSSTSSDSNSSTDEGRDTTAASAPPAISHPLPVAMAQQTQAPPGQKPQWSHAVQSAVAPELQNKQTVPLVRMSPVIRGGSQDEEMADGQLFLPEDSAFSDEDEDMAAVCRCSDDEFEEI